MDEGKGSIEQTIDLVLPALSVHIKNGSVSAQIPQILLDDCGGLDKLDFNDLAVKKIILCCSLVREHEAPRESSYFYIHPNVVSSRLVTLFDAFCSANAANNYRETQAPDLDAFSKLLYRNAPPPWQKLFAALVPAAACVKRGSRRMNF